MVNKQYKSALSYELGELLKNTNRKVKLKKGLFLFQEGQPAKEMYILLSGKVQISKMNAEGKELTLRLCTHNDIVGELTLFTVDPQYLFNAKIVESGEAAAINIEDLERILFSNSQLAYEYMKWMNDHIRKTITKFRDLVLNGKKGALYSTLIRLCNSYGVLRGDGIYIDVSLTNQDLANYCGTARESVSRMLGELRDEGIISVERKKIVVHNLNYLKAEIDCENCPIEYCNIE
ncbi:CRP/FNR family transcriptional regulator, anaerobic regulatory protein [Mesobacillus persicus]|uniref:CRP/FNR family transcriptional regulator, anaerobic regulatory protein n=1 Tax=Mesobacillus persicus TaxID=930146 RepID=A0A1H8HMV1_9BACI|nr:Crp/Fnr family transcriptional regulator [Mesobacillus persicus]SEN57531.1 CRP/FNR family transcriptional regulator, anaerobic regulatory protein [Mesobacillus persicus]